MSAGDSAREEHEHQFPEDQTPTGARVLYQCLLCGLPAADGIARMKRYTTGLEKTITDAEDAAHAHGYEMATWYLADIINDLAKKAAENAKSAEHAGNEPSVSVCAAMGRLLRAPLLCKRGHHYGGNIHDDIATVAKFVLPSSFLAEPNGTPALDAVGRATTDTSGVSTRV